MRMKKKKNSLKVMFKDLEDILNQLESSDIDIDEMVKLYEKGMAISEECKQKIKNAELKIELINQNKNKENKI